MTNATHRASYSAASPVFVGRAGWTLSSKVAEIFPPMAPTLNDTHNTARGEAIPNALTLKQRMEAMDPAAPTGNA